MSVEYPLCALTALAALEKVVQLRRKAFGVLVEDRRPIQIYETLCEALRSVDVLDPRQRVVVLGVAHVMATGLAREEIVNVGAR